MISKTDNLFLECKDHSVSGETFKLFWNEEKNIVITTPQPSAEELPKYYQSENYISHTDASASLSDKLYQGVKKYMLSKKIKWINQYGKSEKTVLDIGAGTGDFLKQAAESGWSIFGTEPNKSARKRAKEKGIRLVETTKSLAKKSFEVITMWHVLEHVSNLEYQFAELHRLLRAEGSLVIALPNFESYDAKVYKEFWAAYDVPRHLWHFSKEGIEHFAKIQGFELVNTIPLIFDAYYVSLLSEKYKYKKMNFIRAFSIGLYSNLKAKRTGAYSSLVYIFKKA